MNIDPRLKPWAVNTGKLAGAAALATVVEQIAVSFFAQTAYGVGAAFFLGLIIKSPFFSGAKNPAAVEASK